MKARIVLVAFIAGLALLAGCSLAVNPKFQPRPATTGVEPAAGQWRTWVLASPDELRPAPPPDQAATQAELQQLQDLAAQRDAQALQQIAYWDAGSPSYRWVQITLAEIEKNSINPPRDIRMLALVNVAVYDALVAAWDAKYTYNRARPTDLDFALSAAVATPHSPAYPSEQAVVAGAASAVLAYAYPDDAQSLAQLAEEDGHSRVLAGVNYPSDVSAGMDLGRAVAAKVIARAQADGSDAKWTGSVPSEPGHWNGQNPVEPLMATWKPWVLQSADQFRPGPPPAYDSPEEQADLQELKSFTRTSQTNQKALYWNTDDGVMDSWYTIAGQYLFEHHLDQDPPAAARVYALMGVAHYDALVACYDAKYTYWAIRPFQLDKEVVTLFRTPNHPSYPAAHGCLSGAIAATLGYLFPDNAAAINARADEAGASRMWAGIHFHSDVVAGLKLGRQVAALVHERAQTDGAQAMK